jgi:hypothetical protein
MGATPDIADTELSLAQKSHKRGGGVRTDQESVFEDLRDAHRAEKVYDSSQARSMAFWC